MERRDFLTRTGLVFGAAAIARAGVARAASPRQQPPPTAAAAPPRDEPMGDWPAVRAQFTLAPDLIHMSGFYLASHPTPVREAIERHRRGLDDNPIGYQHEHAAEFEIAVHDAAADYLGVNPDDIALTDSTTMGLGLLYGGLTLREGQEILTTTHDHYATRTALRARAERTGAIVREITLYENSSSASVDEIVASIRGGLSNSTRIVGVTWVHSGTGVKLPIRAIADAIAETNAARAADDRIILCVDGVHGLGVEDVALSELGCDFFIAGTHKWLFGPRGTGFVWGKGAARDVGNVIIPPFVPRAAGVAWADRSSDPPWGYVMTPGGFHSFEHRWALNEAFNFHKRIGKGRVAQRIHELNSQLKDGLASMKHVTLHTPRSVELSAGIVCFEVAGLTPAQVVDRLAAKRIVASTSPYAVSYARLAPSLLNSPDEVETCLREVRALA